MDNKVIVNGKKITKCGTAVSVDSTITLCDIPGPYVSRGGFKLAGALDTFGLSVTDKTTLDIGLSTGGFTDCLRQRGAAEMIGIDVGTNQCDFRLRTNPAIWVLEQTNARTLTRSECESKLSAQIQKRNQSVPSTELIDRISLVVMDVSFISVRAILPPISHWLPRCDYVILVKPQFEAPAEWVEPGGLITNPIYIEDTLHQVQTELTANGFVYQNRSKSTITGRTGNQEYFFWLTK